jgi:hypothetical protein
MATECRAEMLPVGLWCCGCAGVAGGRVEDRHDHNSDDQNEAWRCARKTDWDADIRLAAGSLTELPFSMP